MPIPKPQKDENKNTFISRCVSEISGEYEQSQALGICYTEWERKDEFSFPANHKEKLIDYIQRCMHSSEVKEKYTDRFERSGFCMRCFSDRYRNSIGKKWN